MSTSAIASSSLNQEIRQFFHTRHNDLQQLGQALSSGDLAGAQTAFNKIVTLGQAGPFNGGEPFLIKQRDQNFAAVGQALQSGDLAGAQTAFNALENSFNNPGPRFKPVPPTAGSSSSAPEVVLNLSNGSGASPSNSTTSSTTTAPSGGGISVTA
jgi:hypothetical protein